MLKVSGYWKIAYVDTLLSFDSTNPYSQHVFNQTFGTFAKYICIAYFIYIVPFRPSNSMFPVLAFLWFFFPLHTIFHSTSSLHLIYFFYYHLVVFLVFLHISYSFPFFTSSTYPCSPWCPEVLSECNILLSVCRAFLHRFMSWISYWRAVLWNHWSF